MISLKKRLSRIGLAIGFIWLTSCGQKGDLYIPEPDAKDNGGEVSTGNLDADDDGNSFSKNTGKKTRASKTSK